MQMDVEQLYNIVCGLYNVEINTNARAVVTNLEEVAQNLTNYWKGTDAVIQTNNIVRVYTDLVKDFNNFAIGLVAMSHTVCEVRSVTVSNRGNVDELKPLEHVNFEIKLNEFVDNNEAIKVDYTVMGNAVSTLRQTCAIMNDIATNILDFRGKAFEMWLSGARRDEMMEVIEKLYNSLVSGVNQLELVMKSVSTAADNWQTLNI